MVEHRLAKARAAGSSPVFRSIWEICGFPGRSGKPLLCWGDHHDEILSRENAHLRRQPVGMAPRTEGKGFKLPDLLKPGRLNSANPSPSWAKKFVVVNDKNVLYNNCCEKLFMMRASGEEVNAADCKSAMRRFKSGLALHYFVMPGWRNWQTHGT